MNRYDLIVTDSSPLITLAKAEALDVLLRQPWPIIIPDVVYRETAVLTHADGQRIFDWVKENADRVTVVETEVGVERDIVLKGGGKARNYGELAAVEVVNEYLEKNRDSRPILLYEDGNVINLGADNRADLITTGTMLGELERSGIIQSRDQILDQATEAGRNVERQRNQPENPALGEALTVTKDEVWLRAARERNRNRNRDRGGFER